MKAIGLALYLILFIKFYKAKDDKARLFLLLICFSLALYYLFSLLSIYPPICSQIVEVLFLVPGLFLLLFG